MGWSRDLGVVTTEEVRASVVAATARAQGKLSEAERARRLQLADALVAGSTSTPADLAELSSLNAVSTPTLSVEELATIEQACAVAEAGVRIMGGRAHVVLGGSDRVETQPEASLKGMRQTSITVTVTVMSGDAQAAPAAETAPARVKEKEATDDFLNTPVMPASRKRGVE